jgi:hypothetical protein
MAKKKQTEIPGTERVHDTEISAAAEDLHEVRARRMKLTEEETAAADRLIRLLHERKIAAYVDEELNIRIALKPGKERVSITRFKGESGGDEGAAEAEAAE